MLRGCAYRCCCCRPSIAARRPVPLALINKFRLRGRNFSRPKKYNQIISTGKNRCMVKTPTEFTSGGTGHLFTPQEASRLLPDVKIKFKEIMERKRIADTL